MSSRKLFVVMLAMIFIIGAVGSSSAVSSYYSSFTSTYPGSATASFSCQICHVPAGPPSRNPYGAAYANAGRNFKTIEGQDSDGDGSTNIVEINAGTNPGDSGSKPAPTPVACTGYTYSAWSACSASGQQTRTVTAYTPSGCTGTPSTPAVLTQACTPPPVACTSYTYSSWSACQSNNTQTRTVTSSSPAGCTGGATPVTSQSCTYVPPVTACTSYTYSAWSACQSNNTQTRTVLTSLPAGCSGGATPATSQSCTYVPPPAGNGSLIPPATSGLFWDDANKKLGIGTTSPESSLSVNDEVTSANRGILLTQNTSDRAAAALIMRKSRGSQESPYAIQDGDYVGALMFRGHDGATYLRTASIGAVINGPVKNGSAPTELYFATSDTDGSDSYANGHVRMVIGPEGDVGIGTINPGQRLEVNGGVRLNPDAVAEPKPNCNADTRGTFWFTQDDRNGDRADVCARDSEGDYSWRRLF